MTDTRSDRLPLPWQDPDFYRRDLLEEEMRRVFDICNSCRRCFNLCDSFPRLFDLVDGTASGEVEDVPSAQLDTVVDACTLCDMCYIQKCPYVPPHPWNVDFPHLMLRARAVARYEGRTSWTKDQIARTDRNGRLASQLASMVNPLLKEESAWSRTVLEKLSGIDRKAALPAYASKPWMSCVEKEPVPPAEAGPAAGHKAVIYATCLVNWNQPAAGDLVRQVLAYNGVDVQAVYPRCCGMPLWEQGQIAPVAEAALGIAQALEPFVDQGYTVVSATPSCTLMLKTEWPLLWPDHPLIRKVSEATRDISDYMVTLARTCGLVPLPPCPATVTFHAACHARAQNRGLKGAELLALVPGLTVKTIERCSGHGGAWGMMKENAPTAFRVGQPVVKAALDHNADAMVSECPLAGMHIAQGMAQTPGSSGACGSGSCQSGGCQGSSLPRRLWHPVEILAHAWGLKRLDWLEQAPS